MSELWRCVDCNLIHEQYGESPEGFICKCYGSIEKVTNTSVNQLMEMRPFFGAVLECVQCGNTPVENPDTQLCATCAAALRKAERQAQKVKIVTPPRKVSAKMAKDLQDYGVLRRKHLAEHPECEVNLPGICDGQSNQVHHCAKRGINLLQADTFKALCQSCHTYIETKMSAEERRERGLLITKNETI